MSKHSIILKCAIHMVSGLIPSPQGGEPGQFGWAKSWSASCRHLLGHCDILLDLMFCLWFSSLDLQGESMHPHVKVG